MKAASVWSVLIVLGVAGCFPDASDATDATDATEATESAIKAKKLQYHQIDITVGPAAFPDWSPVGLSDKDEVFGQVIACDELGNCSFPLIKRKPSGDFVILADNFLINDVNKHGDVGGCLVTDPLLTTVHAAIVRANGRMELIAPLPGEISSCILKISNNRAAVVVSETEGAPLITYVLDGNRRTTFALPSASVEDLNDHGQIAGIVSIGAEQRAYRFDARTQTTTILNPVLSDPSSWGMAINKHGEVLGYSFSFDGVERIGKWSCNDAFEVSFVEGTPEIPTVSNRLAWNEDGLIVISFVPGGSTYLVPRPGVRLDLADLLDNGPLAQGLIVPQINKGADFVGISSTDGRSFLFLRQ